MDESLFFPQKIYVARESEKSPLTRRILERTAHVPLEFIEGPQELIEEIKASRDPIGEGKKTLLVTNRKGAYVKPCPCTPRYIGCNYYVIHTELNCPLDCTYCILQLYLDNPLLTVHADTTRLWQHLDDFLHRMRPRIVRIGTGELCDSLALDHITGRSKDLVSYFSSRQHALFELKTKTVNIRNLLEIKPFENIVIAWSLNSEKLAREEEKGAPPVSQRIEAARLVSRAGYRVAFHFDPLILYPGWKDGYDEIIDRLLTRIDMKRIAWISLGSLRFPPALKPVIKKRFPRTKIIYEEFIPGRDKKLRYPRPLRYRILKRVFDRIQKAGKGKFPVYFCMESRDIWKAIQKKTPRSRREVERLLTLPLGVNDS
jgi:spore photoproduct lyase